VPSAWRCFPWDPDAPDGAPFSAAYLIPRQTAGRFDLHDRPPARYLAESPEHAIGETLAVFRGTEFLPSYLRQQRRPLALVEVTLASSLVERVADCTDPAVLEALGIRPDELAHHDRTRTQGIARRIYESGGSPAGLRWWSALTGAWHTTVLFADRARPGEVRFGAPAAIGPRDTALARALSILSIRVR
jgi:hypothetical protein